MARYSNPFVQYLDGNADVLDGNQLFFFEPGTTTPKDTFSDSTLTTANPNPVVSVAAGRIPDIFLEGTYKVVLKDKNGVTIDTADPVGETTQGQWQLWINDQTYNIPDIVLGSDDEYYRSLTDSNQGNDPTSSPANWEQLELGRIWNANVTYALGDQAIGSDGMLYFSLVGSNLNNNPTTDATSANWRAADQIRSSDGAGTVDAITATYIPAVAALKDELILRVRATGANTSAAPTFAPNGLTAKTIVKFGNQALEAGDIFGAGHELLLVFNDTNDSWELLNPGVSLSGSVIQMVTTETDAFATTTTVIPFDDTIPQNTEGAEFMSLAITPKKANSTLLIFVDTYYSLNSSVVCSGAIFKDSDADAIYATAVQQLNAVNVPAQMKLHKAVAAGDTTARTYRFRAGPASSVTMTFNGVAGAGKFGTAESATMTILEVQG